MGDGEGDHYAALGVPRGASGKEIKRAFQQLAKVYHPDVNDAPGAAARFQRIKEAYDVLGNASTRDKYDARWRAWSSVGGVAHGGGGGGVVYDDDPTLRQRAAKFDSWQRQNARAHLRMVRALEWMTRPRVLMALPFLAAISWMLTERASGHVHVDPTPVIAWFNPVTLRWESPAPWDPIYRANVHTRKYVRKGEVTVVPPPPGVSADDEAAGQEQPTDVAPTIIASKPLR